MKSKWTKEAIASEIALRSEAGHEISYSKTSSTYPALLRAAVRVFGSWEAAVTFAGIDYDSIRKYKRWSRESIIERIIELHEQGADLSWISISHSLDPQLAAAATKEIHFGSWRAALEAAGLDYDAIRRYRDWDEDRVIQSIREIDALGKELNAKAVEADDQALITAARRRFDSWPKSLTAAGFDYRHLVKRTPFRRGLGRGQAQRGLVYS